MPRLSTIGWIVFALVFFWLALGACAAFWFGPIANRLFWLLAQPVLLAFATEGAIRATR